MGDKSITSPQEIKQEIEKYYNELGAGHDTPNTPPSYLQEDSDDELDNGRFDTNISRDEVEEAISKIKPGKACGADAFPNEFLIHGGPVLLEAITKMFATIQLEEWIPNDWKVESVKLIHKGKSKKSLDNFRGIAITSNMAKLFSRIWNKRLEEFVEDENILGEFQGGFRKGRNTMDNAFIITTLMERARKKKKSSLFMAFIDLRKAFDSVWREKLWEVLREKKLGGKFLNIVKEMYRGNKRKIKVGRSETNWIPCNKGIKQGCVLSPMLFAIFLADLGSRLSKFKGVKLGNADIQGLFFADDIVLLAENEENLRELLSTLIAFLDERRLDLNQAKSKIMKLGKGCSEEKSWSFPPNKDQRQGKFTVIEESNSYKYLGIELSNRRLLLSHRKKMSFKMPRLVGLMKHKALNTPSRKVAADNIWRQMVRPILLYGAEVVPYTKAWILSAERTQNAVASWILGVSRHASSSGRRAELGWLSVEATVFKAKLNYWESLKVLDDSRWAKQALLEILNNDFGSSWYKDVISHRTILMNVEENNESPDTSIKESIITWEQSKWMNDKQIKCKLKHHPKEDCTGSEKFIWESTQRSKIMCKLRLGDIESSLENDRTSCHACKETHLQDIREHIILDCTVMAKQREKILIPQNLTLNRNNQEERENVLKRILNETSVVNLNALRDLYVDWQKLS